MTKQVNIITPVNGMTIAGNPWTLADGVADELVNRKVASYVTAPVANAVTEALDAGQRAAGATAVAGVSDAGMLLGKNGAPVSGGRILSGYLPSTVAALAAMKAGARNVRILHVGDSTTMGRNANGVSQWINCRPLGYPTQFAALMNAVYPTYNDNLIGIGVSSGVAADFVTSDPKFVLGGSTTIASTSAQIGGGAIRSTAAGTVYTYTPSVPVDTWDVGYIQNAGYGTFDMYVDGVKVGATVDANGTNVLARATRTFDLGMHTLSIVKPAGAVTSMLWTRSWNSAVKGIESMSGGYSGQTSTNIADVTNFLSASYNTGSGGFLGFLQPDLVTINLGINDYSSSIAPTGAAPSTRANLQVFVDQCRAAGADVVGIIPNPSATTVATLANQQATLTALRQFYADNGILTVDFRARYGTLYETAIAQGWMVPADPNHPTAAGHSQVGAPALFAALFQQSAVV